MRGSEPTKLTNQLRLPSLATALVPISSGSMRGALIPRRRLFFDLERLDRHKLPPVTHKKPDSRQGQSYEKESE